MDRWTDGLTKSGWVDGQMGNLKRSLQFCDTGLTTDFLSGSGLEGCCHPPELKNKLEESRCYTNLNNLYLLFFSPFIFHSVWMFCQHAWHFTTCMPSAFKGQKKLLVALELELQTILSYQMDAGNCLNLMLFMLSSLQPPTLPL